MTVALALHTATVAVLAFAALAALSLVSPWLTHVLAATVIAALWSGYAHALLGQPGDYQEPL